MQYRLIQKILKILMNPAEFNTLITSIDKLIDQLEIELIRLRKRDAELTRLENAGVDNWEGYSYAFGSEEEDEDE